MAGAARHLEDVATLTCTGLPGAVLAGRHAQRGGTMDGQITRQYQAWRSSYSFQVTFPAHAAICALGLAAKYDYDDWAVPIAHASAVFTRYKTTAGETDLISSGLSHSFAANDLVEVNGLLIADNCFAGVVLNVFFWPGVS